MEKANKSFKDYAEASKEVEANLKNAAFKGLQSLEDGLVGIMTGTMKAKDAFRSMAQSIIADLARIFIQKQINITIRFISAISKKNLKRSNMTRHHFLLFIIIA